MAQAPENLTTFIEHKIKDEVESNTQSLATKEDLLKVKSELEVRISETKVDLINRISEAKVDLIKWNFAFWITLALMIIGLYLKN